MLAEVETDRQHGQTGRSSFRWHRLAPRASCLTESEVQQRRLIGGNRPGMAKPHNSSARYQDNTLDPSVEAQLRGLRSNQ